jgi:hypothetical protein
MAPISTCESCDTDFNIYDCAVSPELGKQMLEKQRGDGVDTNSRATNPMFVDRKNGDFRFKSGSLALEMGIAPIDRSLIGLRNTEQ